MKTKTPGIEFVHIPCAFMIQVLWDTAFYFHEWNTSYLITTKEKQYEIKA